MSIALNPELKIKEADKIINKIKKEVYKISGVQLEVEPRFLGEF